MNKQKKMGRPKSSIDIPADMLGKWEILRKPTHARILSDLTNYSEQTIRDMFSNGTAPTLEVLKMVDNYYSGIAAELLEMNDYE